MRVLYVTHCTDMSGANRSMVQMIIELRDNHGVDPFVVYPKVYNHDMKSIEDALKENHIEGFSHRLTCFQRRQVGVVHKVYFVFISIIYLMHILFLLRNRKFDIVHSNSSVIDMGFFLAKFKHAFHIWHFREVASLSFGAKSVLGERYQRLIYHHTNKIIAISNNVKEEFKTLIPLESTVVVPNGIKPPVISQFPNHESEIVNICIVGRVEPNKNQKEAVEAVQFITPSMLQKVKLHIIGNYKNDYGKKLVEYVKTNHLDDSVIFHGARNDVDDMLQNMNIGLMLSKHEAFGRVTVEYMMHGVCVIASNTSANPEIIHDDKNGLLYEIGNPQELANKIAMLLNNRNKLKELASKGYNDSMGKYQSVVNSNRVFEIYESLV